MPGKYADDEKCQQFVANLKRMREAFGWSQERLATESHCTVVAMIESFARLPLVEHGVAFDAAFGLRDVFAKDAREMLGQSFAEAFQPFPAHEATAHDLYIYEHSVFTGLIQTERYMRAVFAAVPNIRAEEVEQRVTGRLARQEILFRDDPDPPRVWTLIDETALRRPVAVAAVMYEQCQHALEASRLPHVSLAVVPYADRWHIGLLGACTIVERDGTPRVVNLEDLADGRVSEDPEIVRQVALRFRAPGAWRTLLAEIRASTGLAQS
jgi:transcriptional regulator with XRE-family HTH domain